MTPSASATTWPASSKARPKMVRLWLVPLCEMRNFSLGCNWALFRNHVTAASLGVTTHWKVASRPSSTTMVLSPDMNFTSRGTAGKSSA